MAMLEIPQRVSGGGCRESLADNLAVSSEVRQVREPAEADISAYYPLTYNPNLLHQLINCDISVHELHPPGPNPSVGSFKRNVTTSTNHGSCCRPDALTTFCRAMVDEGRH